MSEGAGGSTMRRSMELITLGWFFGSVWNTATTGSPTTVFLKELNASPFQFGVVAALPFIASLLSLPSSLLIERTGARKKIFLYGLYLQRLLWFPIALLPLWLVSQYGSHGAAGAMQVFLLLMFIMHAAGAAGGPAWVSWMADVVPERLRGKYFSRRRQWGLVSAIPTALLAGWILDRCCATSDSLTTLRWCAILFMCAAVFGLADIHLFQYLPGVPTPPRRGSGLIKALGGPLRDRQFLWFAAFVGTLTFAVGFMQQFITLYLLDRNGVNLSSGATQLIVLVVPMAAQFLALPVWGSAVDRMGKKPVLALAGLGMAPVALGWCLLGPHNLWLAFILAAAHMVLWCGVEIANFNFVLDMSGTADANGGGGSAYVAVNSVIVNVAGCLGGLVAGLIAQGLKDWTWTPFSGARTVSYYDVLFVLSGVLRFAAVAVFLPFLHEPSARPAVEALRFILAGIRHCLSGYLLQPLRMMMRWIDDRARAGA
jgi:MFS family permease